MTVLTPLPLSPDPEFLVHHRVCPLGVDADGYLVVAIAPSAVPETLDELSVYYQRQVAPQPVDEAELDSHIEGLLPSPLADGAGDSTEVSDATDVRDLAQQAPVVRFVNQLLREAVATGASDIHLDLERGELNARLRVDGFLASASRPPAGYHTAVVSRIKLLADLDIAEQRRPQDGRIRIRLDNRDMDVRIGTLPTMFGESVALRFLDRGIGPAQLQELGMPAGMELRMRTLLRRPHGLLIVTGPTGSGKTSTLYAGIRLRDAEREKIVTVEDPVEYHLGGVTQVPVQREHGVSFATALRAMLRQDPDVILVGEMRDAETATLAVQAALTGHLVLTTLHTNDAVAAVPRLLDLGVPAYLVAATLIGVVGQRLVRRRCQRCSRRTESGERAQRRDSPSTESTFAPGDSRCAVCRGTGYRGRVGLFELLECDAAFRALVSEEAALDTLRAAAKRSGFRPLITDGDEKSAAGITSAEEVLRVTYED